jgi:hypothetical protein
MEESIANDKNKTKDENRLKNSIFIGLDPKLNEKVIAILKRHLNRVNKMGNSNCSGVNSIRTSPRMTSSGINMTDNRFSSADLLNGIQLLTGIDPKTIQSDAPKPPSTTSVRASSLPRGDSSSTRPMSGARYRISEYVGSMTAGASTE